MSYHILQGDCLQVMDSFPENHFHSCVTDPPYHLKSIVDRFGKENSAACKEGKTGVYARSSVGFMGKKWDGGDVSFRPETWSKILRVIKPGAYLLAFGGSRTYHRIACAIEDSGFELRDTIMWLYGSGFPKSHNQKDEWEGWGTALKPAFEPIIVARKPLIGSVRKNLDAYGVGAINIEACRVELNGDFKSKANGRPSLTGLDDRYDPDNANTGDDAGRWPANVIHDGSDEVLAAFPDAKGQQGDLKGHNKNRQSPNGIFGKMPPAKDSIARGDSGSAARFFYCAKASKSDRGFGNSHPTVKPAELMRYLCRLVTPVSGHILDPFAGSGSTGKAALLEGYQVTCIEREDEYVSILRTRLEEVSANYQRFI